MVEQIRPNIRLRDVSRIESPMTRTEALILALILCGSAVISIAGLMAIVKYAILGCVWC